MRDRWNTTAEEVRARTVHTAEDWRDRSTEGIERALRQAAEARDESLAALDDDDDDARRRRAPGIGLSRRTDALGRFAGMADAPEIAVGPLAAWIAGQRWFANSTGDALAVEASLPVTADGAVRTLFVRDASPGAEALYQVPLVVGGPDGIPGAGASDGPHDPAFVASLIDVMLGDTLLEGDGASAHGQRIGWTGPAPTVRTAKVLSGEQSNTSIIVSAERADGDVAGLMVKVFRALHDGENPDVVLQSAISAAGSTRVPATYGALVGTWPDPEAPSAASPAVTSRSRRSSSRTPATPGGSRSTPPAPVRTSPSRPATSAPRPRRCTACSRRCCRPRSRTSGRTPPCSAACGSAPRRPPR